MITFEEMADSPAAVFAKMRRSLDAIKPSYGRVVPRNQASANYPPQQHGTPYLETHLQFMLTGAPQRAARTFPRRGTGTHTLIQRKNANDYRLALPSTIVAALETHAQASPEVCWCAENVTATWIACYLNGIFPDESQPEWGAFECSHRCAFNRQEVVVAAPSPKGWMCVEPTCLVWESKAMNQSRGNDFCVRECKHADCALSVCACQGIHLVPCL